MATFVQNIRKIKGEAVYGTEMRNAIAEAIQQALDLNIEGEGIVFCTLTPIASTDGDYLLTIQNGE